MLCHSINLLNQNNTYSSLNQWGVGEKKNKQTSIFPRKLTLHAYLLPNIILQGIKMTTKTCFIYLYMQWSWMPLRI